MGQLHLVNTCQMFKILLVRVVHIILETEGCNPFPSFHFHIAICLDTVVLTSWMCKSSDQVRCLIVSHCSNSRTIQVYSSCYQTTSGSHWIYVVQLSFETDYAVTIQMIRYAFRVEVAADISGFTIFHLLFFIDRDYDWDIYFLVAVKNASPFCRI